MDISNRSGLGDSGEIDEFTPRERGLLIGKQTAMAVATGERTLTSPDTGEPADADMVIEGMALDPPSIPEGIVDEIREVGMRERLDASEDPDAEAAFWAGFAHGVRAYVVEVRLGTGDN
jgi:hypothetical protein